MIDAKSHDIVTSGMAPNPSCYNVVRRFPVMKPPQRPFLNGHVFDYEQFYQSTTYVVPLEYIVRFGVTGGSSILKKHAAMGEAARRAYEQELGLTEPMRAWQMLAHPIFDLTSKYEPEDRNVSRQEALLMSGLGTQQFLDTIKMALLGGYVVRGILDDIGLTLWDMKWEFAVDDSDCFFVDSGLSLDTPVAVTGVTLADPLVVTAAAHGFNDGDEVDFSDIIWEPTYDEFDNEIQPDQLNGNRYFVANKTTNTFELEDEDGNAIDGSAFDAYVEGGYARKAVQSVGGLWHLEGQDVAVLADGNVVNGLSVTNGTVTLPRKASRVHVGLKYTSDVETLNIESPNGTVQGKLKRVVGVTVRFFKSRGLWHGPTFFNMTEMKQREFEDMGDPTELLTGDKELTTPSEWNKNGRICFRQRDPLPMTILAVVPEVHMGESDSRSDDQ